jgi:hypothetical protein
MILTNINNLINNSNIIYHYSLQKYPNLLTLNEQYNQGVVNETLYKEALNYQNKHQFQPSYLEHISFLFDKLPIDLIISNFKDSNNALYTSSFCYEYEIDINSLSNNLNYWRVVENPINVFFRNYLWIDSNFLGKDLLFFGTRNLLNIIVSNEGSNFSKFKSVINKYKDSTRTGYLRLINDPDFNIFKKRGMYAPLVPHLMLFPITGIIKYSNVKRVELK